MSRLGPQVKKLFEVSEKTERPRAKGSPSKKYTFILPIELMKKVKHTAIEKDKTISEWLTEAIERSLS